MKLWLMKRKPLERACCKNLKYHWHSMTLHPNRTRISIIETWTHSVKSWRTLQLIIAIFFRRFFEVIPGWKSQTFTNVILELRIFWAWKTTQNHQNPMDLFYPSWFWGFWGSLAPHLVGIPEFLAPWLPQCHRVVFNEPREGPQKFVRKVRRHRPKVTRAFVSWHQQCQKFPHRQQHGHSQAWPATAWPPKLPHHHKYDLEQQGYISRFMVLNPTPPQVINDPFTI